MKFTKEQVLDEVRRVQLATLREDESPVFDCFRDLAAEWLSGDNDFDARGFLGFYDRTPEQIVADFQLNGRLDPPLSPQEFDAFLSKRIDNGDAVQAQLQLLIGSISKHQGTDYQGALRDVLTDLRHVARKLELDFDFAIEGSAEVEEEENENA